MRVALIWTFGLLGSACVSASHVRAGQERNADQHSTRSGPEVQHWGAMREVLRERRTHGRVTLQDVLGPNTIAVGAIEGLAGEITVDGSAIHLTQVVDPDAPDGVLVRPPHSNEQATLLVLANVEEWTEHGLTDASDLEVLEHSVREIATAAGFELNRPIPFRIRGRASELQLHVLNNSCPVADPNGPKPWRFRGEDLEVVLIGFYAEDSSGILTHHGQNSHIHAIVESEKISGHLDAVDLSSNARLFLPKR